MSYKRRTHLYGPDTSVDNGLVKRWCHGSPEAGRWHNGRFYQGCGHYITTREMTWDTNNCKRFHQPTYFSWKAEYGNVTQQEVLQFMLHQPHCRRCLAHDNSYAFPAWYDIPRPLVDKLAAMYAAHFPSDVAQPFFHPFGDRHYMMRLHTVPDIGNDMDIQIDLDTLQAEFYWIESDDEDEDHEFHCDLSQESGWNAMLEKFPQPNRIAVLRDRLAVLTASD